MIVPLGSQTSVITALAAVGPRHPRPDEVRGVVVAPPRDSRVEVRVEVVTQDDPRPQPLAAELPVPASYEAALYVANLEATKVATQTGAPDLRRAAAAYNAHAEFRGYSGASNTSSASSASGAAREPPRYLDVRA